MPQLINERDDEDHLSHVYIYSRFQKSLIKEALSFFFFPSLSLTGGGLGVIVEGAVRRKHLTIAPSRPDAADAHVNKSSTADADALTQDEHLVAVDVSGITFQRLSSFRRSLIHVSTQYIISDALLQTSWSSLFFFSSPSNCLPVWISFSRALLFNHP